MKSPGLIKLGVEKSRVEMSCNDVLTELENIDDEADVFEIRFVRIQDEKLAEDFSLEAIPSLVYFRGGIPIVYQGDLVMISKFSHDN